MIELNCGSLKKITNLHDSIEMNKLNYKSKWEKKYSFSRN